MPETALEWSSPIGNLELGWLAGPWRRIERARLPGDRLELFRAHEGAGAALARTFTPRLALADATTRLRDAITKAANSLAPLEVLLQASSGSADAPINLNDILHRVTAPARVETLIVDRPAIVTDIDANGPTNTRVHTAAPAAMLELHRRAVAAALGTRVTLAQAARTTLTLAATLVALTGPGTAALAVPLAWRFVHSLLKEHAAVPGH